MAYTKCYKKSTKGVARLLALIMLLSSFAVFSTMTVNAEEQEASAIFQCMLNEDFEDETLDYVVGGGTTAGDYVSTVDIQNANLIYGKALKMDLSKAPAGEYNYDIKAKDRYIPSDYARNSSYYAEISFDITPIVCDRPLYIYFMNGDDGKNITILHWSTDSRLYMQADGGLKKIGTYVSNQMMNVKVVQQWTDSENNSVCAVTGVYVNGTLVDTTNVTFPSDFDNKTPGKFDLIRLFCKQNTANSANGMIIDNLSMVRYTSDDGMSPVADFSALKSEIKACSEAISSSNSNYSDGDKEKLKADIQTAVKTANNIMSTQTQVNEALTALKNARAGIGILNVTPLLYEDFEDETYNVYGGNLTNGTIDAETYADKFYNKVLKYTHTSNSISGFEFVNLAASNDGNRGSYNATTAGDYAETSIDFRPFGTKTYGKNTYVRFGNEGTPNQYAIVFCLTMNGELTVQTFFGNQPKTYYGGDAENSTTGALTIAKNVDLNRMHNLKLVLYKNANASFSTANQGENPEISGIYLDGKKLDFTDNTEQTIYPMHSPVTRTPYIRLYCSNASSDSELGNYGVFLDNVTMTKTNGARPVEKGTLKSAITESYYVYDTLNDEKKASVGAKLDEAETLYANANAGQSECDEMARQLNILLLPSLSTYIGRVTIPSVISSNELVLPSFDDGETTTAITSDKPEVITTDGKVIQPTDKAVDVNISIVLSRESGETASQVYTVKVMPKLAVEINSVEYKDVSGKTVYSPVDNGTLSNITVSKNSDDEAKVIAAVYSSGTLESSKVIDAENGTHSLNLALGSDGAKKDVKFFVWSDLVSAMPLQETMTEKAKTSVFVLSDSIYAVEPVSAILDGQGCLGQVLQGKYDASKVEIKNRAYCGATLKSFDTMYRLNTALNDMKQGDYAIISFAHNDQKSYIAESYCPLDTKTTAPFTAGTYQAYLERYIKEVREQGATPILITSVPRFVFGDDGKLSETHGGYIQAMKDVAASTNTLIIDLNGYATKLINENGEDMSAKYYNLPDTTHLSVEGAEAFADYISECIAAFKLSISKYKAE